MIIFVTLLTRDLLMTDEERDRAMDFVIESLGDLTVSSHKQEVRLEKLTQSQEDVEHRLDRYERILKLMLRAGRRERRIRREQENVHHRRYRGLLESQAHTDSRLDALVDIVRQRMNGR